MKAALFFFSVIIALPVLADIAPSPMSLHRIGYEVLAEVVGSVVVGGAALRALIRRYRGLDGDDVDSPCDEALLLRDEEDLPLSKGMWVLWTGGSVGRLAERSEDGAELRFLEDDEVSEIEHKLEVALPTLRESFEKKYEVESKAWLKDANCPHFIDRSRWRNWWRERCVELVVAILLQDELLRQRLKGVPIEWIVDCVWKDPIESQVEERARFSSPIDWLRKKREREPLFVERDCSEEIRREKMREHGRRVMRIAGLIILAYSLEWILIGLGVVNVSSPHVEVRVVNALAMILYPLAVVILFECLMSIFRIVFAEIGCLYCSGKLKWIVARREKLFACHHGETKWRVPGSELKFLPDGFVVGDIGSACDAALKLNYEGVAQHHAEIYFDKKYWMAEGSGFVVQGLRRSWIGEYVEGQLPKKEKTVYLNAGRMICVGPYAILKVVSVPSEKDNAFVFELTDGNRHEEKAAKISQPGTSTWRLGHSENTVPFVCDDVHTQPPLVVGEQGGVVFGRSRRSDVRLDEQDVSGRHVEIVREGDQILAVCLSGQGIVVNDERIEPLGRRQLHEGDCMRIGKKTEVRVVRLPKNEDDVMALRVQDCCGTREEVVRLPKGDDDTAFCCDDGDSASDGGGVVCTKPVIYLYPKSPMKCSVCVRFDGELTCTYPAHGADGWRDFVAEPDGTLTFPDGRKFYCLYWEGTTPTKWDFSKGYCVKGEDTAAFFVDILAKMGLSFREANEFIIYWLPRMQENPYNVISFQDEIYTKSAKLEIEPKPDSILRVFMAWKASDCPVDISEPEIKPFERKGFTVVEWGGAEVGK